MKCSCGSEDLVPLKFGGRQFQLQAGEDVALFRSSGFVPEARACRGCGQVLFSVPDAQRDRLLAKPG